MNESVDVQSLSTDSDPFLTTSSRGTHKDSLYLCSLFLAGALVRHATDVLQIPLPYTVIVFFAGVIGGYLPLGSVVDIGPHTIIYVFMPILIFEGSFAIDIYIFKQIFVQVLILAGPALVIVIVMIAGTSMYLFKYEGWSWVTALLFGSILSATDPVAVVAIMKELGTNKRLALLVEGESMLNDGTAMLFYEIFVKLYEDPNLSASDVIIHFFWISLGGPAFGYIMAKVAIFWLQWTFNDSLTEIAITLSMAYLVFYIGDAFLKVSGVLAVVTLGATLSEHRTSISPEVEVFLHSFWETLAFMANTLIFAICGFIITKYVIFNAELQDCIYVIILYFAINVIRLLTIMMFSPVLKRLGYGLTWQDGLVCTWSGLRGAIGLALALIVFKSDNPRLGQAAVGGKILFHVSLIVVSTLLINATTVSFLLTFLGATDVTPARRNAMKKAIKILDETREKTMNVWKIDRYVILGRFLADADWDMVNKLCTIEDPFMSTETMEEKELRERQGGICPHCHIQVPYVPTQSEIHKMLAEAIRKYLKLLKQNCWLQFEKGLLTGFSVRKLIELAEEAADKDCEMIKVKDIKRMWRSPKSLTAFKRLVYNQYVQHSWDTLSHVFNQKSKKKAVIYLLSQSQLLLLGIYGIDSFLILSTEIVVAVQDKESEISVPLQTGLQNANILIILVSGLFYIFRMVIFGTVYLTTIWFFFNTISLILAVLDIGLRFSLFSMWYGITIYDGDGGTSFVILMFTTLRLVRILQLGELTVGIVLFLINHNIQGRLTLGYDMARGFVRATEIAVRLVDHISDDTYVQETIKTNAENDKMNVLRELGLLQGTHPDVALGVKTCQAIRSVLNVMREGMHHLIEEGGIDEPEGLLFVKVIESKMKRLMASPPRLEIPSTKKILSGIPWINRERDLIDFIQQFAEKKVFHFGDVIMHTGDLPNGIYFVISGLVKVEAPYLTGSQTNVHNVHTIDFLSTGNVIGEISVLTQRPRSATLTCETLVKTLYLSTSRLRMICEAFSHLDPPLISRLWRVCAVRISLNILANVPSYHGLRKETLLARLENAELEYIDDACVFQITTQMVDVVLILGECKDQATGERYIGPCYIPKTCETLRFAPKQTPRPLVFYTEKLLMPATAGTRLSLCARDRTRSFFNVDFSRVHMNGLDDLNF